MNFFVYIIFSSSLNKFYVGYTTDIQKRLLEHNSGISVFTARANDWELKYCKTYNTREEAMKKEQEIKRKKSRKYIEWLITQL